MSVFGDVERECTVASRAEVAEGVHALELFAANGRALPPWDPGSHVDLFLPVAGATPLVRQYSLCGDPAERSRYRVAVLTEPAGRGGSVAAAALRPGDPVRLRGPRNHFPFEPRPGVPATLLAGGIGITALLPMLVHDPEARLLYAGRSRRTMAFCPESESLVAPSDARVRVFAGDEGERLDVAAVVQSLPEGGELWCCGPARMLAAVETGWSQAGRPAGDLHIERFVAKEFGPPVWPGPFEVELALTGVTVQVPPGRTLLDAIEREGVLVVSSCRTGTCGTCESPVLEGAVEHRDSVLTPDEQAAGDTMMVCVSRAAGPRLILDL